MGSILIYGALTVLAFVCVLVVLFVLMQKPSANAGMGSALGGATSESVFGGEAAGMLSKATVVFIAVFFILGCILYLAFVGRADRSREGEGLKLNSTTETATVAPAETEPSPVVPAEQGASAAIVPVEEPAAPVQQQQTAEVPAENVPVAP